MSKANENYFYITITLKQRKKIILKKCYYDLTIKLKSNIYTCKIKKKSLTCYQRKHFLCQNRNITTKQYIIK